MMISESIKKIQVICPVCKTNDIIELPSRIINNATRLTAVSIPKGKICKHHFQIFLDKNFSVRGYQKVDYELNNDKLNNNLKANFVSSLELHSLNSNTELKKNDPKNHPSSKKERELERIYNEFWDIIDDYNETFRELILKDKRRKRALIIESLNNHDIKLQETIQ